MNDLVKLHLRLPEHLSHKEITLECDLTNIFMPNNYRVHTRAI